MKILAAFLSLMLLVATAVSPFRVKPPTGYDGKLWASTFALYVTAEGMTKPVCTVTPYEKTPEGYRLISAGHCVQMVPAGAEFSVADDIGGPLTPITLVKARLENTIDFSVFELKTKNKYTVAAFDTAPIQVGDPTVSVHFAEGLGKQISHGVVASSGLPDVGRCKSLCGGYFIVQMYGAPGASGALVLSEKTHHVIGLVVFGFSGETLGMGIEPISEFAEFLSLPAQPHPAEDDEE